MSPAGGDGAAAGAPRALNQDEVGHVTPDLLNAVLARDNRWRAWQRVKAKRGAPGIDGVRLEDFRLRAEPLAGRVRADRTSGRKRGQTTVSWISE